MIRSLINLYIILIFVDALLSYLPQFRNKPWALKLKKLADFTCGPVRRMLPPDLPFDFSPLIVFLGLRLFVFLFEWLW